MSFGADPPPVRTHAVADAAAVLAADLTPGAWELFLVGATGQLCVLDPRLTALGWGDLAGVVAEALARPQLLTLLIPFAPPPLVSGAGGPAVASFVAPALLEPILGGPPEKLAFAALEPLLSGRPPAGVGVVARECPPPPDDLPAWTPAAGPMAAAVVMAHRGSTDHLRAALAGLAGVRPGPAAVRVGFDGDVPADFADLTGAEFFADPAAGRVGPYAIRQALVEACREPAVVFHDSDDLSTADRFHWLAAGLSRAGGLVGSYELRYDPDDREIRPQRYPADGNAALRVEARHPLLHPTSAVAVAVFRRAGGFGTDCVFGNDIQFLFRASLGMPVTTVPRFLYVRREHAESLTAHPDTGMTNPLRAERNRRWRADYAAVLAGTLPLAESSLVPVAGPPWRGVRVEGGGR